MINQTKWHAEEAVYRAVTGAAGNFPNGDGTFTQYSGGDLFPKKGTIPKALAKNGTITSEGAFVRGTSTLFTSQVEVGDYIYDNDAAVRKVRQIESDTSLILDSAFPSDVTDLALKVCKKQYFVMVYAKSTGSADAELQEAPFRTNDTSLSGGAPFAYDAEAADAEISFECHR